MFGGTLKIKIGYNACNVTVPGNNFDNNYNNNDNDNNNLIPTSLQLNLNCTGRLQRDSTWQFDRDGTMRG